MKKKVVISIGAVAVVLATIGVVASVRAGQKYSQGFEHFSGIGAKLNADGTAKVAFHVALEGRPDADFDFEGTSSVKFGISPSWDTRFTKMTSSTGVSLPAVRRLHSDNVDYFQSAAFKLDSGAEWARPGMSNIFWPGDLMDPKTDVAELTTWVSLLGNLEKTQIEDAQSAGERDLDELAGAPNRYELECRKAMQCPATVTPLLGQIFNVNTGGNLGIWLDDDGRLRQLTVTYKLLFDTTEKPAGQGITTVDHPRFPYEVKATFTLSDYGAPVTVESPDSKTVSKQDFVYLKS